MYITDYNEIIKVTLHYAFNLTHSRVVKENTPVY